MFSLWEPTILIIKTGSASIINNEILKVKFVKIKLRKQYKNIQ